MPAPFDITKNCLFCGREGELKPCVCGHTPHLGLNDIDYTFFILCECGRGCQTTGNIAVQAKHDAIVALWNSMVYCVEPDSEMELAVWSPDKPEPITAETALAERLAAYKAGTYHPNRKPDERTNSPDHRAATR